MANVLGMHVRERTGYVKGNSQQQLLHGVASMQPGEAL